MPSAVLTSLAYTAALRGAYVRRALPVTPWAMLRVRNEHSRAFRGRYSPENNPLGVEIVESQYWPHVRSVDVIAPPQWGKSFHAVELPTLYDLCEARETVFTMNGSEDNAKNMWRVRWLKTITADPVLSAQLKERMDGGEWYERHFTDGGLLYSTGPESASALSQRESRIVRCSELEKTRSSIGNEASSYALAKDRAAAYPTTHLITSDCTITVREGLSWRRFVQGDRSRPFIPCPGCGRYAVPAHPRHVAEEDLVLREEDTHLFLIPEEALLNPAAAEERVALTCRSCGCAFTDHTFRAAARAGVWVPHGCRVVRLDDQLKNPIPRVTWLDELNLWAAESLNDPDVVFGGKDPGPPPVWHGPRLPDGVTLDWTPDPPAGDGPPVPDADKLPAFRQDPRQASNRSFWSWRVFAPKYTLGEVAREMVAGENGMSTGDLIDDQKNASQKCFVLPWVEPISGSAEDLNEDAVLCCVTDLPRGSAPAHTIAITRGIDIGVKEGNGIHWVVRAWTSEATSYLLDHGHEETEFKTMREQRGLKWDPDDPRFQATRRDAVYAALDRVLSKYADGVLDEDGTVWPIGMTYVDAGYMSEEIYLWCAGHSFHRLRPCKGKGHGIRLGRRSAGLAGMWNDFCEKRALACRDMRGGLMRHQYFDPADSRKLMILDADFWKREVHSGIQATARSVWKRDPSSRVKPWWFMHADLAPKENVAGSNLKRYDRYITQVVAERWEEWVNPRTKRKEIGWRVYQDANHLLDAESYALAAAGGLGVLPRYAGKLEEDTDRVPRVVVHAAQGTATAPPPVRAPEPVRANRPIRRAYG
jgi:phage terminase large subunit GpA-like protein